MCGLPLFPPKPKHHDPERALDPFPPSALRRRLMLLDRPARKYTPAERAGLFVKAEGSHSDCD